MVVLLVNEETHQKRNHVIKAKLNFRNEITSSENKANHPAYSVSCYDLHILSACLMRSFYRKTA